MHFDRKGYGQGPPQTKTFQTKDPLTKPPDKNPREQLRENLYRGLLSGIFVLGLLKIGGPICVTYFWGVPECVTKCDRGRGVKLAKNNVTYFMDGPLSSLSSASFFSFFLLLLRVLILILLILMK